MSRRSVVVSKDTAHGSGSVEGRLRVVLDRSQEVSRCLLARLATPATVALLLAVVLATPGCGSDDAAGPAREAPSASSPVPASPSGSPSGSPSAACLPDAVAPPPKTWNAVDPISVNPATVRVHTVSSRTDLLRLGPEPKVTWIGQTPRRTVVHQDGREHVVPSGARLLWDGYLLQASDFDSPGSAEWHGWDGSSRVLGSWSYTDRAVSPGARSSSGTYGWVVGDYPEPAHWTVFVARPDGCTQQVELPALASLLRGALEECVVQPLGFLPREEFGAVVDCPALREKPVTTTSGRTLRFAGTPNLPYSFPQVSPVGDRLVTSTGPNVEVVRAYRLPDGKPIWATRYPASLERSAQFVGFSPSGRRALVGVGSELVVIDPRSGRPLEAIRIPGTAGQAYLEDDDHVLFTDNGEEEPPSDRTGSTSARNDWFVRCSLDGACERATPVVPGKGLRLSLAE